MYIGGMQKFAMIFLAAALMGAAPAKLMTQTFEISGLSCTDCVNKVTKAVSKQPGVRTVKVDLEDGTGVITYEVGKVDAARIIASIKKAGYKAKAAKTT